MLLSWRLWLLGADGADSLLGEDDGAVAVGLEVDADIEFGGSVVKPLDTSWCANGWELECLGDIVGGCAVGVSSLDDTNLQLIASSASRARSPIKEAAKVAILSPSRSLKPCSGSWK